MTDPGPPAALHIERSGGFGGLTLRASIPLVELNPQEREALELCFEAPEVPPSGPDRFVYRLRLGDREAVVQEDRVPPGLEQLFGRLAGAWQ